ncbi:RHS repeat domain-containing protein [Kitasatospora sp. NE20-6]|uniref:RHS repeat domain-containing protein n=1 Tax=Kitasatospora sp. NE20-6 TaxID=2859066 RepID=UPI0038B28137
MLSAAVAAAALIGGLPAVSVAAPGRSGPDLPAVQQPEPVAVKAVRSGGARRVDQAAKAAAAAKAPVVWPAAGTVAVEGAAAAAPAAKGRSTAHDSAHPVTVASGAGQGRLNLTVADRAATGRAGVDGVLLSVSPAEATARGGRIEVSVDYTGFAGANGGDWASRLALVRLPACALTTPQRAECRTRQPLPSTNDSAARTVSAKVETAAAQPAASKDAGPSLRSAPAAATVLALTATASGPSGDYTATSLKPSATWSAGGSTGGFAWSYPIGVPSVPGGLAPSVALGYSSQAVDGRTSVTNNQPGWIGDGWDWEPGYIERRYKPCEDDQSGGTGTAPAGDQCWSGDNATLSLGGKSTELVYEAGKGWHPASDSAEKVQRLTGAANGDNDGEHWKVTTADGTQYFFGLNRLPGFTAGAAETNSAWTVPVYGNHTGEPCHTATPADSWCQQAWRWQLDYVVDPRGNAMAYYWNQEKNNYARNWSATTGKGTATPYVRGGWLDRVEYGLRSDTVYSAKPMGTVNFGVDERCLTGCGTFDAANAKNWPDVPFDQSCADGADCGTNASPTYWSRKRLVTITTRVQTGGAARDVDSWSLAQSFPPSGDGISTPMWLASVTRTGKAGGTATLPPVTFAGEQKANRVDRTGDGLAPFVRLRLSEVTTETGATVGAYYSEPECTTAALPPTDGSNTLRCYPVKRHEGTVTSDDWFHTYVVTRVVEGDNLAESPDKVTEYAYLDGAAWAKNEDEFAKAADRTYSVNRGYGRVQTRTGTGYDARTLVETRYFRGLDGAQVKDSAGTAVTDRPEFAGMVRETATYNGDGGALVSATSTTPWRSAATATRSRSGLPALSSYFTGIGKEQTRTAVTGGERRTSVTRSFDEYGMVSAVSDLGDEARTGDERCTTTTYARNTDSWLLTAPAETETLAVACGAPASRPADVVDAGRSYYDGSTVLGAAPTEGLVTETRSVNGAGDGYDTTARTSYDDYGRIVSATDTYGRTTTTAYTPATGEVATRSTVVNPLGHAVTTDHEPLRGLAVAVTDANGKVTATAYDPMGRVTKIWLPTRSAATYPDAPNYGFDYLVRNDGPVVVTTRTLQHDSTYETSYAFYDGLLRERQTQRTSPDRSGRLVTEQFYDTRGLAWRNSGTYYADGAADATLVTGQELKYPASTDTLYDGAGRPTAAVSRKFGDETKRTTTLYLGDGTTVVPPKGGTSKTTLTDARGNVTELKEYTNDARTASQSVVYRYDRHDKVVEIDDTAGDVWRYGYDVKGRQIHVEDPDKGTSDLTLDTGGRVTDVSDARGTTLHTDYDALGRRTAVKQNGTLLAAWTYDTVSKGLPSTATEYVDGSAYTTAVTAYTSLYKPSATQVTVPAAEGALAGTYKWTTSYNANTGQQMWTQQPAVGGLPQERVTTTYTTTTGLPSTTYAGTDPLVSATTYDHYGRTVRDEYGAFGKHIWQSYEYDEHTGNLARAVSDRDLAPQRIDDTRYTYDAVGGVTGTSTTSGQDAAAVTDTQCVTTDALRRVTEAWTATADCATAPAGNSVGGPDAYWTSYTYDAIGNRKTETRHATGTATGDTVRTYTRTAGKPHALATVDQSGPDGTLQEVYGYDATGNTTSRKTGSGQNQTQTLEWDRSGHLSTVVQGSSTSRYLYDADGQRLIRRDSTGTTLTLPGGTEVRLTPAGTLVGTRYYSHGGEVVAVRTAGKLTFLLADHHDTATAAIDAVTLGITRRKSAPFGAPRGTSPGSAWPGGQGFVGGTLDGDTGLTHLGAREYDPNTGRFISVDPKMDSTSSQELHAYAYANNNPLSTSDPRGDILPECWSGQYTCKGGTEVTGYGQNYEAITRAEGGEPAPDYCATHKCTTPPPQDNSNGGLDKEQRKARANFLGDEYQKTTRWKPATEADREVLDRSTSFSLNYAESKLCDEFGRTECMTYRAEGAWAVGETGEFAGTIYGEVANAYRHVIWQASLTAQFGREKASRWADAHEAFYPGREEQDHRVDLLNNEFAQTLGERAAAKANGNAALTVLYIKRAARAYIESGNYGRKSDLD